MRATTSAVTYRKTPYDPISTLLTTTSHAKRVEEGGSRDGSREVMGCVGGGVARWTWERSAGVIPWIDHQYRNSPNGRGAFCCGCGGGVGAHWRHSTRKERRGGAPSSSFVACLYSRCGSGTAEGGALTYRVVPVSEGRDSTIDKR